MAEQRYTHREKYRKRSLIWTTFLTPIAQRTHFEPDTKECTFRDVLGICVVRMRNTAPSVIYRISRDEKVKKNGATSIGCCIVEVSSTIRISSMGIFGIHRD